MNDVLSSVLITPARNEADYIELTLKPVVIQIARTAKWVIVNDGSTGANEEIVGKCIRSRLFCVPHELICGKSQVGSGWHSFQRSRVGLQLRICRPGVRLGHVSDVPARVL